MRKRDCVRALAIDLGVSEELAIPTALKQLLESIQARATMMAMVQSRKLAQALLASASFATWACLRGASSARTTR
jgi:hypothetical protein